MKISLILATLTVFSLQSQTAPKKWTTADIDLQCQGQITVTQLGSVEHKVKWLSTRNPEPQALNYTLAPINMKFLTANEGCSKAQNLFDLPFEVEAGSEIQAVLSQYGHVTQEQMLKFADLNSASSFQIKQTFYTATGAGDLPVFPFYHVESIDFIIQGKTQHNQIGIHLDKATESSLEIGPYFSIHKFLDMAKSYGVPSPNYMNDQEKYETVQDIIQYSQSSDLSNPQVLKIVDSAMRAFAPKKNTDSNKKVSSNTVALKKHLNLVVPFLNEHLLPFAKGALPEDIEGIYKGLQQTLNFHLFPPFSEDLEDAKYAIYTLIKMPTALVVSTGNAFSLTAEQVEQFLTLGKKIILAYNSGSPLESALAPYVSMEKTLQIQEAAMHISKLQTEPGQSWIFPLTEKSKNLIQEILILTH